VGTLGAIGAKLSAYAGIVDQIFKTDFHKKIVGAYGGKDPALIRKELMALTLPIIRTLVEPKGPIPVRSRDKARPFSESTRRILLFPGSRPSKRSRGPPALLSIPLRHRGREDRKLLLPRPNCPRRNELSLRCTVNSRGISDGLRTGAKASPGDRER